MGLLSGDAGALAVAVLIFLLALAGPDAALPLGPTLPTRPHAAAVLGSLLQVDFEETPCPSFNQSEMEGGECSSSGGAWQRTVGAGEATGRKWTTGQEEASSRAQELFGFSKQRSRRRTRLQSRGFYKDGKRLRIQAQPALQLADLILWGHVGRKDA